MWRSVASAWIQTTKKRGSDWSLLQQLASWSAPSRTIETSPLLSRCITSLPDELLPVVAIVGRPNVGKSAVFNRLVRKRKALVYNTPMGHVTRDYQESPAQLGDLRFIAVDTSGLEPFLPSGTIQARATKLTSHVLRKADVTLFLMDGQSGVLPPDQSLAKWLRESGHGIADKVVVALNKCERRGKLGESGVAWALTEASRLGFGEPVAISAETGEGMVDLYQAIQPKLDPIIESRESLVEEIQRQPDDDEEEEEEEKMRKASGKHQSTRHQQPIQLAIMGLVNVGKSTLTNLLLNEERCLTGPEPGLTRDAISVKLHYEGRDMELVDTAGWIRRARLTDHDDSGGVVANRTLQEGRTVLRFVHVVLLVVDAERAARSGEGLTHAEASLAASVAAEGRALIVIANKMDAVSSISANAPPGKSSGDVLKLIQKAVEEVAPTVRGNAVLPTSALTGQGANAILPAVIKAYDTWNERISTSRLNRWIEHVISGLAPGGGSELSRVKYVSQIKTRPPTFVAFVSGGSDFGESSQRFLANLIRKEFDLTGVPIRITVRLKKKAPATKKTRRKP